MATKKPLVLTDGQIEQLQEGDAIAMTSSLFEIDVNGGLMPITEMGITDEFYELDVNNDIMPIAAV